ncbi:MAG: type II secretion system protein, partial [Planctomycetota bacterium]
MFSTTKPAVDGRAEPSFSKRIRGFTLIELLVVVAVMAVLMGIVVPAIYTTRELTLEIVCAVNIRQLADAMSQYAAVNEQFAPWRKTIIGRWNDPNAKRLRQSYIFPHLAREEDVFVCPMFLKMTNGVGTFS